MAYQHALLSLLCLALASIGGNAAAKTKQPATPKPVTDGIKLGKVKLLRFDRGTGALAEDVLQTSANTLNVLDPLLVTFEVKGTGKYKILFKASTGGLEVGKKAVEAELFGGASIHPILIDEAPCDLLTLVATLNGKEVFYREVHFACGE